MKLQKIAALSLISAAALNSSEKFTLSIPADASAGMYDLSRGQSGPVYLSWLQPRRGTSGYELLFSKLIPGGRWSEPHLIASGENWFINYADHPSIEVLENGSLVAHWLVRDSQAKGQYGYGIEVALSGDAGRNWRTVYRAGIGNVEDYTGFLSFLPGPKGFTAAYLSPPDIAVSGHIKTLRFAKFGAEGQTLSEQMVDSDVCTCCPTASAMTPEGPVVAYRDHQPNEIRDISIIRQVKGHWLPPQTVSADGWRINGCPTDGPAAASNGSNLAVAWFTRAKDIGQVKVAFSEDAGRNFGAAIRVDAKYPLGRPDLQLINSHEALVSWIEKGASGGETVCVRRVSSSGQMGNIIRVGASAEGRAARFPKIRLLGQQLLVVWKGNLLMSKTLPVPAL